MNTPTKALGEVVASALVEAGLTPNKAARRSGIPRSTLERRLVTGDFKYSELEQVASLLGVATSELTRRAEVVA